MDGGNTTHDDIDLITVNAKWQVFGQELSVNYGRQISHSHNENANDPLNMLPGFEPYTTVANVGVPEFTTKEIRLSSLPNSDRPFDYDIGWFSKKSGGPLHQQFTNFLPGAFGGPAAKPGTVTTPNSAYGLVISNDITLGQVFDSFYGDVKFHIDHNTELSGGLAIIRDRIPVVLNVGVAAGRANAGPLEVIKLQFPAFLRPLVTTCEGVNAFSPSGLFTSTTYAGTCDVNVPAGTGAPPLQVNNNLYTKALYNFSLSHKFSDDILVYASTGSSYRSGLPALGNVGLPAALSTPLPEEAKSYEVGIKTTFGRTLHINASVFQIDYKNQLTSFQGVHYFNSVQNKVDIGGVAFYRNVDARVRGFEVEVAAQPIRNLSLAANVSYSEIKSLGGNVPCDKDQSVAANVLSLTNPINFCPSVAGQVLNQNAPSRRRSMVAIICRLALSTDMFAST